jgi:hypothetical protein
LVESSQHRIKGLAEEQVAGAGSSGERRRQFEGKVMLAATGDEPVKARE